MYSDEKSDLYFTCIQRPLLLEKLIFCITSTIWKCRNNWSNTNSWYMFSFIENLMISNDCILQEGYKKGNAVSAQNEWMLCNILQYLCWNLFENYSYIWNLYILYYGCTTNLYYQIGKCNLTTKIEIMIVGSTSPCEITQIE